MLYSATVARCEKAQAPALDRVAEASAHPPADLFMTDMRQDLYRSLP